MDVIGSFLDVIFSELLAAIGLSELVSITNDDKPVDFISIRFVAAVLVFSTPALVLAEAITTAVRGSFRWIHYRMQLFIYILNRILGRIPGVAIGFLLMSALPQFKLFEVPQAWYGLIYAYIVFEFAHFIYHWLGHRVRLFWCLHATHHCPEHMNLSVSYAHFFLESTYADIIRISICLLLGVDPLFLMIVLGIDSVWGHVIHVGEEILPKGRMGLLEKFILTPSHHRIHHARNSQYIDKNFCNLLPIWDRVFGTYKELEEGVPPEYGIKRAVNINSLPDVYFGEFIGLFRDIKNAPGFANKLAYLFMPPGWHPATVIKTNTSNAL